MDKFNLIDENWILVATKAYTHEKVSLRTLFAHAQDYRSLAGEMAVQDFAILRLLLSVLHTTFSRVDANGVPYASLGGKKEPDEKEKESYLDDLRKTWRDLWERKSFPEAVDVYLDSQRDRFYLLSDRYPFYQVPESIMTDEDLAARPGVVPGKTINRRISATNNKPALFNPRQVGPGKEDLLAVDEFARWLPVFQGYSSTSDKGKFRGITSKATGSKGWLYDIGGVYLQGENLFETLLLNLVLVHPEEAFQGKAQRPIWEWKPEDVIEKYTREDLPIDNLAELYTHPSRAVYLDPATNFPAAIVLSAVKLSRINYVNHFLEPMTSYFETEDPSVTPKQHYKPALHTRERGLWASFGQITITDYVDPRERPYRRPPVFSHMSEVRSITGDIPLHLSAVGFLSDGNPLSWVPVHEVSDTLSLTTGILTDTKGWLTAIAETVEKSKDVVEVYYRLFLANLLKLRGVQGTSWVSLNKEQAYFHISEAFDLWLSSLSKEDQPEEKVAEWEDTLYKIMLEQGNRITETASPQDYIGKKEDNKIVNFATILRSYQRGLYKKVKGGAE